MLIAVEIYPIKTANMKVYISKKELREIYEMNLDRIEIVAPKWYTAKIVEDFIIWVNRIENANDMRDLYAFWFLHCEQLKPPFKKNEYTIRAWSKWWRIYFRKEENGVITIIDIFDYNKHKYWK